MSSASIAFLLDCSQRSELVTVTSGMVLLSAWGSAADETSHLSPALGFFRYEPGMRHCAADTGYPSLKRLSLMPGLRQFTTGYQVGMNAAAAKDWRMTSSVGKMIRCLPPVMRCDRRSSSSRAAASPTL